MLIQELPQSPEDSQKRNPGQLIFSPPLLSRDAARLLIVKSHTTDEHFQIFGFKHRLSWTPDGRPHPAVTGIQQHAAAIAACRNG